MYIHVIIVAPEKILTPADIPWRREWRHSANSTPLQESITAEKSEANAAYLKVAVLPDLQDDGSASLKEPMMTTVPKSKEQFTDIV